MVRHRLGTGLTLVLVLAGGSILAGDLYLGAKAVLARVLIRNAYVRHLEDGGTHRPWAWADIAPVARIDLPGSNVRRYVLTGGTGASLAFDIGHLDGTALPNRPGNCVLTGHRDGRLRFLQHVRIGDRVVVRTFGSVRVYIVVATDVVDAGDTSVLEHPGDRLVLVTCWPFQGLADSNLRYVVSCRPLHGVRYARENRSGNPAGLLPGRSGSRG